MKQVSDALLPACHRFQVHVSFSDLNNAYFKLIIYESLAPRFLTFLAAALASSVAVGPA